MNTAVKYIVSIACFCAAVFAVTYLLTRLFWVDTARAMLEAACALSILILFLSVRDVRNLWMEISSCHRVFIAGLFFCLFTAQFFGLHRISFPFQSWEVFNRQHIKDNVIRHRYVGIKEDGSQQPILPAKYFSSLKYGRLTSLLKGRIENYNYSREKVREGRALSHEEKPSANEMIRLGRLARQWAYDDYFVRPLEMQLKEIRLVLEAILKKHNAMYPQDKFVALEARRLVRDFYQNGKVIEKEVIARATAGGR